MGSYSIKINNPFSTTYGTFVSPVHFRYGATFWATQYSTVYSTIYSTIYSTFWATVYSTVYATVWATIYPNCDVKLYFFMGIGDILGINTVDQIGHIIGTLYENDFFIFVPYDQDDRKYCALDELYYTYPDGIVKNVYYNEGNFYFQYDPQPNLYVNMFVYRINLSGSQYDYEQGL